MQRKNDNAHLMFSVGVLQVTSLNEYNISHLHVISFIQPSTYDTLANTEGYSAYPHAPVCCANPIIVGIFLGLSLGSIHTIPALK